MNDYLANFLKLYSDSDALVTEAIMEKKGWILTTLFVPGDFNIDKNDKNEDQFPQLEAVLEDKLLFSKFPFVSNDEYLTSIFDHYVHLVLYSEMKKAVQPYFWLKYDFSKMSPKLYQALLANFYPRIPEDELEINGDFSVLTEALKLMMIGEEHERIIILDKAHLKKNRTEAPLLCEFIVHKDAPKEVKETLLKLATVKNVKYQEVMYE